MVGAILTNCWDVRTDSIFPKLWLTSEFAGLRGFSRRSGGMFGWLGPWLTITETYSSFVVRQRTSETSGVFATCTFEDR